MLRSLLPVVLVVSSGCTLHHARLESTRDLVVTRAGDGLCGPIGIRRASLGARWGEYVRVSVSAPAPVHGEARLHVDGRAYPLQRFSTEPQVMGAVQVAGDGVHVEVPAVLPVVTASQTIVLDAAWTNERLDVPTALGAGHVIDITLAGLRTAQGSCTDVVFTVEQGVFQPTVDERAWIAELTRRGGPELQAWLAAEETRKAEIRAQVFAEADRRKAAWAVEVEARREAARVEAVARVEAEQVEAVSRAEAVRVEVIARVEAERREEARREEVRQAHYAEYERRREARVEASVRVPVIASPMGEATVAGAPAPKRALVCRAPQVSRGSFGGSAAAPVTSVPMVAEESCEEVVETTVTGTGFAAASTSTQVISEETRVTRVATDAIAVREGSSRVTEGRGVAVVGEVAGAVGPAAVEPVERVQVTAGASLASRAVSAESVAAAPAMEVESFPEWSTPQTFQVARVAVTTEQVTAPPAPPCPAPPPPRQVTVVDPQPGLALLHLFGAIVNVAAQVQTQQPVHTASPVQQPVHGASPVQQQR